MEVLAMPAGGGLDLSNDFRSFLSLEFLSELAGWLQHFSALALELLRYVLVEIHGVGATGRNPTKNKCEMQIH